MLTFQLSKVFWEILRCILHKSTFVFVTIKFTKIKVQLCASEWTVCSTDDWHNKVICNKKKGGYRQLNVHQLGSLRTWDHSGKCYMDQNSENSMIVKCIAACTHLSSTVYELQWDIGRRDGKNHDFFPKNRKYRKNRIFSIYIRFFRCLSNTYLNSIIWYLAWL